MKASSLRLHIVLVMLLLSMRLCADEAERIAKRLLDNPQLAARVKEAELKIAAEREAAAKAVAEEAKRLLLRIDSQEDADRLEAERAELKQLIACLNERLRVPCQQGYGNSCEGLNPFFLAERLQYERRVKHIEQALQRFRGS